MTQYLTVELLDGINGAVVLDSAGRENRRKINIANLSGSAHTVASATFRSPPTLVPPIYLRMGWDRTTAAGTRLFIDEVILQPGTQLYQGGPWMAVAAGVLAITPNDTWTVQITNDRAGDMHKWLDRFFDLRNQNLLFPTSGTYLLSDSLIA